jgi:hypothetical protein
MAKKRKIDVEDEIKGKTYKLEQIFEDDGTTTIKFGGEKVDPSEIEDKPSPIPTNSDYILTNPQYWWRDAAGWHCYCWGGSTC